MDLLATIRPDEWNFPLFLHIVGAMGLVGALSTAAYYLFRARRDGSAALTRVGFRTLLFAGIPSYLVSRLSAQWLLDKQGLEDSEDAWIEIGFIVTDVGVLLLLTATIAAGVAARRADGSVGSGPAIAAWCCSALLVAYTVALWAMAARPV
jgi:uncharacterized membrane protein